MCKPYMGLRYFYVPLMEVIVVEVRVDCSLKLYQLFPALKLRILLN